MKIAIVHSYYRSKSSGENVAVALQAEALSSRGHEVVVISQDSENNSQSRGYLLRAASTVALGFGASPEEEIEAHNPDVVHVHNLFPNWSDKWLALQSRPVITTIHNFRQICAAGTCSLDGEVCFRCPSESSLNAVVNSCYARSRIKTIPLAIKTRNPRNNSLFNLSSRVIFLSKAVLEIHKKFGPANLESKAVVLPNFVQDFAHSSSKVVSRQEKRWAFVGRLSAEKGILPMIESWPEKQPLTVIGDGPERKQAECKASGKDIVFLGNLPNDRVRAEMKASIGLVVPSVCIEHGPFTMIEAFQSGTPVVSLKDNGAAEVILEMGGGKVFNSFADLPVVLDETARSRARLSREARKIFDTRYNKEDWLKGIESIYQDVL